MKFIVIAVVGLTTLNASADVECSILTIAGEKKTEAKVALKKVRSEGDTTAYEVERDGYVFTTAFYSSGGQRLVIREKATNRSTNATYNGMTPGKPDAFVMAALADEGKPTRAAKLTCPVKQ